MKVPIDVEGDGLDDVIDAEYEVVDESEGAQSDAVDPEAEERARVEAAIRAGEEAADRELAGDAKKLREERDALQRKLTDAEDAAEAAQKEAAEAKDRVLRLQADWDNYRRRTTAEREVEKTRAAEKLVVDLLPVIDDMERAIAHAGATEGNEQLDQFVSGVSAVQAKMSAALAKHGVEVIDPAGEPFDPLAHQAVGRVQDAQAFDETVAQVYQKGYRLGGKVIRTAMVTVTYGGPKRPTDDAEDAKGASGGGK